MEITRRDFMKMGCAMAAGCMLSGTADLFPVEAAAGGREAYYYEKLADGRVRCTLCPCCPLKENCGVLGDGEICVCNVRMNKGGKLWVTNYGTVCALHLDEVEKNPIYHMMPGSKTLALASPGCNLACQCCQNWQMSQFRTDQVKHFALSASQAVSKAVENNCSIISYTYTEPVIFLEYVIDIAVAARKQGLRNCVVTGGYIYPEPMRALTKYVDTFSVSIKGFSDAVYKERFRGLLSTIKDALLVLRQQKSWFEIVILVIPTISDDIGQITGMVKWIHGNLGEWVPLHFTRFVPEYKLKNLPKTPVAILEEARKVALKTGMRYCYIGNVPGHDANNTYCHSCRKLLIQRVGFRMIQSNLRSGKCSFCGTRIPGFW
jgi:pyruvate formate lyase activating enzyme